MPITKGKTKTGNIYFTIGLPRSGKSILCDQWVSYKMDIVDHQFQPRLHESICEHAHIEDSDNPRVIVCSDNIRIALHGCRWSSVAEESVHSIQGVMIRSLLERGFDVIVDGTHTTKSSIARMLRFDENAHYIYVNTNADTCKLRAHDQQDLHSVIDRMEANLLILSAGLGIIARPRGNRHLFTLNQIMQNIKDSMSVSKNSVIVE